jgi:hypothetical protein
VYPSLLGLIPEPGFLKLGMYITATESILNKFLKLVGVSACVSPSVARQRLGENVVSTTNTHAKQKIFERVFSMRPCHIEEKQAVSSSQNF